MLYEYKDYIELNSVFQINLLLYCIILTVRYLYIFLFLGLSLQTGDFDLSRSTAVRELSIL